MFNYLVQKEKNTIIEKQDDEVYEIKILNIWRISI